MKFNWFRANLIIVHICFVSGGYLGWPPKHHSTHHDFINVPKIIEADSTVILTHVIFRHGNRTGQLSEIYPKDPFYNYTYFPFGRGQLTNVGKEKEYNIGKELRARYNKFLGDYFYPDILEAVSTDYNRTKASLELVLASLFPPRKESVWNKELNWQPVPYNYNPTDKDPVLMGLICPNYVLKYQELIQTDKWKGEFNKNKEVFAYISKNTGLNITTYRDVYNLYFGLSTEDEWGHRLPDWTKSVWPKTIIDLAIKNYYAETATTDMVKLAEGYHLKKIIEDTKIKNKTLNEKYGRKIYLYSAHENNIAEMLVLLNVFQPPHIPTYGSYLIFEVHNINNVIGIKLYYQRYVSDNPILLKLPACSEFCPLEKFERLFQEYLPSSEDFCYQT